MYRPKLGAESRLSSQTPLMDITSCAVGPQGGWRSLVCSLPWQPVYQPVSGQPDSLEVLVYVCSVCVCLKGRYKRFNSRLS